MSRIISVVGAKGGTLKTASVAALGHLTARAGRRVVMVDADPQADLTSRSGHARVPEPLSAGAVEVRFAGEAALPLTLLRGGRSMEGADFHTAAGMIRRAAELAPDLVLVDAPPALGPVTAAAVAHADLVLVPAVPGKESLERLNDILNVVGAHGRAPVRVVVTLARTRSRLLRWMRENLDDLYPGLRLPHEVPFEMRAGEAALYERPVTLYAPGSRSAAVYREMADDLAALFATGVGTG